MNAVLEIRIWTVLSIVTYFINFKNCLLNTRKQSSLEGYLLEELPLVVLY